MPPNYNSNEIVRDIIMQGKKELLDIKKQLEKLEKRLANSNEKQIEQVLKSYGKLQSKIQR